MNTPNETFDLVREKQELEAFLSTFSAAGPPPVEEMSPPEPVEPATPYPAIFGKFDITVPVKKMGLSRWTPERMLLNSYPFRRKRCCRSRPGPCRGA